MGDSREAKRDLYSAFSELLHFSISASIDSDLAGLLTLLEDDRLPPVLVSSSAGQHARSSLRLQPPRIFNDQKVSSLWTHDRVPVTTTNPRTLFADTRLTVVVLTPYIQVRIMENA